MSDGRLLHGQLYDPNEDMIIPYTEQMRDKPSADQALGDARTEITPNDRDSSVVKVFGDPTNIDTYSINFPGTVNINLPDVLESVSVTFNQTKGEGNSVEEGDGASVGSSASLSLALGARAQASTSMIPDVNPVIKQYWGSNVPCQHYLFYEEGNPTAASIITRLNALTGGTVNSWPMFKPVAHTFTCFGQEMSLSVEANVKQYVAISGGDTTHTWGVGTGENYSTGASVRSVRIPPTIHDAITISVPTLSDTISATAQSSWPAGTNWPAQDSGVVTLSSGTLSATVTPTSLAATSPASIPTSGLYLYETRVDPWKYGFCRIYATVVDFSVFA